MAYIYFKCPSCEGKLKTTDFTILGKRIRCPRCGSPCPVPMSEKNEPEAEPAVVEEELATAAAETQQFVPKTDGTPEEPDADNILDELLGEEDAAKMDDDVLEDLGGLEEISSDIAEGDEPGQAAALSAPAEEPELAGLESEEKPKKKKKKKKGGITLAGILAALLSLGYLAGVGAVVSGLWAPETKSFRKQAIDQLRLDIKVNERIRRHKSNKAAPKKKEENKADDKKKPPQPKKKADDAGNGKKQENEGAKKAAWWDSGNRNPKRERGTLRIAASTAPARRVSIALAPLRS